MQLLPQPLLAPLVRHYLVISHQDAGSYRFFSDGSPGMVFHLGKPFYTGFAGITQKVRQPRSFVYGQATRYQDLYSDGSLMMIVVVLQPDALYPLFKVAAAELLDGVYPVRDLLGAKAEVFEEKICTKSSPNKAIKEIENFLLSQIQTLLPFDGIVKASLKILGERKGAVSMEGMLRELPVTGRQLERKFNLYLGLSPKKYANMLKIQSFLKTLRQHTTESNIASAAYQAGYYDQAHLNNSFKNVTGISPSKYLEKQNSLVINLLQVS